MRLSKVQKGRPHIGRVGSTSQKVPSERAAIRPDFLPIKTGQGPDQSSTELVRRFLPPETSDQDAMCAAISLMGQCSVFVRSREQLAQPPFNLKIDETFVARLTDFISDLALKGMARPVA